MVKRSLSQSAEEPSLCSCLMIRVPYSFFQSQHASRNLSRPRSCFSMPLFSQLVDDLNLGRDCCMVGTRLPQSLVALHSLITDQDILHGVIQCMTHVQLTGNVWRRHHDGERLLALSFHAQHLRGSTCCPAISDTVFPQWRKDCNSFPVLSWSFPFLMCGCVEILFFMADRQTSFFY